MKLTHLALATALLALIGFADATFLTLEHYRGATPPCFLVTGCATVTTSSYSTILNIPVALLGALYYLTILIGSILYLDTRRTIIIRLVGALTPLGFIFTLWFLYVQAFILNAFCVWCILSATTSTLLFITGLFIERHHRTLREHIEELLN